VFKGANSQQHPRLPCRKLVVTIAREVDMNLQRSVGFGGVNLSADVLTVKKLINQCIGFIVPRAPVTENDSCDPNTIDAIRDFQFRVVKLAVPDGRVDPAGKTLEALTVCASGKHYVPNVPQPGASQNQPGKTYTDNPKEVPTKTTTPTASDVVSMLLLAWTDLTVNGARTLTAQFMAETGGGRYCFNWNLGNVKSGPNDLHMYLRNVWECDTEAGAQSQVAKSNGLAHIATAEEIKQHGWSCPSAVVVFQPPHPQCRFRAYSSLADGAQRWLTHHKSIAQKNAGFLTALNSGDTTAVAHALKQAGYYTASEASYAQGMAAQKKKIDSTLGPIQ
jgi:hypothetical protein